MVEEAKDRVVNTDRKIEEQDYKRQPHERDESPDGQGVKPRGIMQQAASDLEQRPGRYRELRRPRHPGHRTGGAAETGRQRPGRSATGAPSRHARPRFRRPGGRRQEPMSIRSMAAALLGAASLVACAGQAVSQQTNAGGYAPGFGPNPTLPAPEHSLIPTVNMCDRRGLAEGHPSDPGRRAGGNRLRQRPGSPALAVRAAERRRAGCREQQAGQRPEGIGHQGQGAGNRAETRRCRGRIAQPIILLRGVKADGTAETKTVFAENLNSPSA
jgi:hypothetical protein